MLPVFDASRLANPPHSHYSSSKIAENLVRGICHLPSVAEGRAQVFKFLRILKLSATVAKYRWVGAKEGHGFGLVHIQRQPFQSHVGVELVKLELEVVGNVGS